MPKVTFLNERRTVEAKPGQTLLQVAEESGIDLFRGMWPDLHCGRMLGWCNRCKLWATPLAEGALGPRTAKENSRLRINGAVPRVGTQRLACQVVVSGDCEVRTRPGFLAPVANLTWEADPAPSKWRDRWDRRNDEPDEDEAPKKKAAPAKAAAVNGAAKPNPEPEEGA